MRLVVLRLEVGRPQFAERQIFASRSKQEYLLLGSRRTQMVTILGAGNRETPDTGTGVPGVTLIATS